MIAIRIAAKVATLIRPITRALDPDSPGGKRITPAEAEQIAEIALAAVFDVLDPFLKRPGEVE